RGRRPTPRGRRRIAWIRRIACCPWSCRPFLLEVLIDYVEHPAPEGALAIHPVGRLAQHVGLEREPMRAAVDDPGDDPGLLEHLQVLRDRGLRDPEAL